MAIRKNSKVSGDVVVFNYLYMCPQCKDTFLDKKESKNKKCKKCDIVMELTSTTTE